MAQDSEKRFTSIMDKLFQPTKSTPSSSSNGSGVEELRRGKKRPNPESALALVEPKAMLNVMERYQHFSASASAGLPQTPICKPWDRGDLMRRLATFKSMTWFAKPKVVSAVNCARRGWVNVDTDTIACESCGARLLFSTPSAWTRQQVEKAALVFSLKLDSGHKLLCPWIDNICDETLAQFPPMPPPVLVDKFRERSSALLQLLALPVISPSAIEYMKSTQLEEFLKWALILECGNESTRGSQTDSLGNQCQDHSATLYYQAQKLISLCGWEPRSLPYLVDCEDGVSQSVKDVTGQNPSINVHSAGSNEIVEVTEDSGPGAHKSVVLDCRLCGASVGLWAFSTVARPVEFFRIVGYAEVNSENRFGTDGSGNENLVDNRGAVINTASNDKPLHKESSSHLNLTIAGGPPPTKQNFKATISLPVIGRALRAKFSFDYDFRDYSSDHPKEIQSGSRNKNLLLEGKDHTENNLTGQIVQAEDTGLLSRRQDDHGSDSSINEDTLGKKHNDHMPVEGPSVTGQDTFSGAGTGNAIIYGSDSSINEDTLEKENNDHMPAEGPSVTGQDSFSGAGTGHAIIHELDSFINEDILEKENNDYMPAEGPSVTGQDTFSSAGTGHAIIHGSDSSINEDTLEKENNDHMPAEGPSVTGQGTFSGAGTGHAIIHELDSSMNEDTLEKETNDHMPAEGPSVTGQDTFSGAGTSHAIIQHPTETTQNVKLGQIQNDLLPENVANVYPAEGKFGRTEATDSSLTFPDASLSIGNGIHRTNERSLMIPSDHAAVAGSTGKDPKQQWEDNAMKFDPIRQHRHFCPWIVSTGGESPGWQQTLYALHRQREGSPSSPAKSPPSSSVIKVDDPVASVRKLFMSPVSKRMKSTLGSS